MKHWLHSWIALAAAAAFSLATHPVAGQATAPVDEMAMPMLILPTTIRRYCATMARPFINTLTARSSRVSISPGWVGGTALFEMASRTRWGILYPRFHEGIDIKPVARAANGEPLDEVRSIADGVVVHTNRASRHSSYGRYVVVEHWWRGSPYYSLYPHLNAIHVEPDQPVAQGTPLGLMGYTGSGINRRRAHVHVEVNLLLNRYFQGCYDDYFPSDENRQGLFNGLNTVRR